VRRPFALRISRALRPASSPDTNMLVTAQIRSTVKRTNPPRVVAASCILSCFNSLYPFHVLTTARETSLRPHLSRLPMVDRIDYISPLRRIDSPSQLADLTRPWSGWMVSAHRVIRFTCPRSVLPRLENSLDSDSVPEVPIRSELHPQPTCLPSIKKNWKIYLANASAKERPGRIVGTMIDLE
jgi:hypothetical protein